MYSVRTCVTFSVTMYVVVREVLWNSHLGLCSCRGGVWLFWKC